MQQIKLTLGMVAIVDDEDFERLNQFNWSAKRGTRTWYATRQEATGLRKPKQRTVRMHAVILGTPKGLQTDHIDGDGLNNTRSNLRVVTNQLNQFNKTKKAVGKSSRFRGVSWHKPESRWISYIAINAKKKYLGLFKCEYAAAQAYDDAGFARDLCHFTPNFAPVTIVIDRTTHIGI